MLKDLKENIEVGYFSEYQSGKAIELFSPYENARKNLGEIRPTMDVNVGRKIRSKIKGSGSVFAEEGDDGELIFLIF